MTLTFGNASLQGSYAFSTSGRVIAGNSFFARAGSFTANGSGGLIGGIEDVNPQPTHRHQTPISFTGILLDWTGWPWHHAILRTVHKRRLYGAPTSQFRIVVLSAAAGPDHRVQFAQSTTALTAASGEMDLQPDTSVYISVPAVWTEPTRLASPGSPPQRLRNRKWENSSPTDMVRSHRASWTYNGAAKSSNIAPTRYTPASAHHAGATRATYSISANGRGRRPFGPPISASTWFRRAARNSLKRIRSRLYLVGDAFKQQTITCSWGENALTGSIVFATGGFWAERRHCGFGQLHVGWRRQCRRRVRHAGSKQRRNSRRRHRPSARQLHN